MANYLYSYYKFIRGEEYITSDPHETNYLVIESLALEGVQQELNTIEGKIGSYLVSSRVYSRSMDIAAYALSSSQYRSSFRELSQQKILVSHIFSPLSPLRAELHCVYAGNEDRTIWSVETYVETSPIWKKTVNDSVAEMFNISLILLDPYLKFPLITYRGYTEYYMPYADTVEGFSYSDDSGSLTIYNEAHSNYLVADSFDVYAADSTTSVTFRTVEFTIDGTDRHSTWKVTCPSDYTAEFEYKGDITTETPGITYSPSSGETIMFNGAHLEKYVQSGSEQLCIPLGTSTVSVTFYDSLGNIVPADVSLTIHGSVDYLEV